MENAMKQTQNTGLDHEYTCDPDEVHTARARRFVDEVVRELREKTPEGVRYGGWYQAARIRVGRQDRELH
jgi:hypothetical protein